MLSSSKFYIVVRMLANFAATEQVDSKFIANFARCAGDISILEGFLFTNH